MTEAQIVQATGIDHNQIGEAIPSVAQRVFDTPTAFDATNGVLNPHPRARQLGIEAFLTGGQFAILRLFLADA
jgi:hypothetical protein